MIEHGFNQALATELQNAIYHEIGSVLASQDLAELMKEDPVLEERRCQLDKRLVRLHQVKTQLEDLGVSGGLSIEDEQSDPEYRSPVTRPVELPPEPISPKKESIPTSDSMPLIPDVAEQMESPCHPDETMGVIEPMQPIEVEKPSLQWPVNKEPLGGLGDNEVQSSLYESQWPNGGFSFGQAPSTSGGVVRKKKIKK